MYTLMLLICWSGVFCFYNTSRKAKLISGGAIEFWLQSNQTPAKLLGMGGILLSTLGLILMDGAVMGTLHAILMMMAAGCYIISLTPFRLIRFSHILGLGVLALVMEFLIF
jgi:hypothetical protein